MGKPAGDRAKRIEGTMQIEYGRREQRERTFDAGMGSSVALQRPPDSINDEAEHGRV